MGALRKAWRAFPDREAAVLSAVCWWATSWAFYSLDDGNFELGDWLTVVWLAFIVVAGAATALRGYQAKDEASRLIVLLGAVLALLLFGVAVKNPDGFLEAQIGIIASLILALAGSKAHQTKKRRKTRPTAKSAARN